MLEELYMYLVTVEQMKSLEKLADETGPSSGWQATAIMAVIR